MSKILRLKNTRTDFAVKVLLTEQLHAFSVSPFSAYLTTVADIIDNQVVSSRTLFEEALGWVEREELPNYEQVSTEVFSRRYSFSQDHRITGLGMIEFEAMVIRVVQKLTEAPSINLVKRTIKPLTLEDVQVALKDKLSDFNTEEIYITGVSVQDGERVVTRSRTLAEDLFEYLAHDDIPFYHGDHLGVYAVANSAQEQHLHPLLTLSDVSELVIDIVADFLD